MNEWRTIIRCYVSLAGNNQIAAWYGDLLAGERADADEFIKNMRGTREWQMPNYRPRLHSGEGLGELRWPSGNKQHRLMGFFMGGYWYAVVGCTHKQQVYDPCNALDTAKKRKRQIERAEVTTIDYDL